MKAKRYEDRYALAKNQYEPNDPHRNWKACITLRLDGRAFSVVLPPNSSPQDYYCYKSNAANYAVNNQVINYPIFIHIYMDQHKHISLIELNLLIYCIYGSTKYARRMGVLLSSVKTIYIM